MATLRALAILAVPTVSVFVLSSRFASSVPQIPFTAQPVLISGCCDPRTPISSLPYTISTQGSYYLTHNLVATGGAAGVIINADNVTIDLNGFTLDGAAGSGSAISMPLASRDITIFNGAVTGFPGGGIDGTNVKNCNVAQVHLAQLAGTALIVGPGSLVRDCNAISCGNGFSLPDTGIIHDCLANSISGDAFLLGYMSIATHCVVNGSGGTGMHLLGYGIQVRDCALRDSPVGILIDQSSYSQVMNNTCVAHSQAGIRNLSPSHRNRIQANDVSNSAIGIDIAAASQANVIVLNTVGGNGTNYSIGAGNDVGPIGTAATSTSPWSNIEH